MLMNLILAYEASVDAELTEVIYTWPSLALVPCGFLHNSHISVLEQVEAGTKVSPNRQKDKKRQWNKSVK
jgi:hypothetical protein